MQQKLFKNVVRTVSYMLTPEATILQTCSIAEKYGYSFYDCMIISAALESNCAILYSKDLHNGHLIEQKLVIKNPFV